MLGVASWCGVVVGLVAALAASALENYFFVRPLHTFQVARPDDVVAIVAFFIFALGSNILVNLFRQRSSEAELLEGRGRDTRSCGRDGRDDARRSVTPCSIHFAQCSRCLPWRCLEQREGEWVTELASGEQVDSADVERAFPD